MRKNSYRGNYEREQKVRIPMSVYLSYMLVLTLVFTGVSFSKYATTASAEASARVAKFAMSFTDVTSADSLIELEADGEKAEAAYSFTVTNSSEVKVRYYIVVDELPDGVTVTVNDGNELDEYRDLAIGASASHTLSFTADSTAEQTTEDITLTVSVYAEQVD